MTTTYAITEIRGVTCPFTRPWVRRLTHKRTKKAALVSSGPPGWYCGSFVGGRASAGACTKNGGYFRWQPKLPPPPSNLRVYDIKVVGSATWTTAQGSKAYSVQATETADSFRMRLHWQKIHHTVFAELYGDKGRGSGSITVDWGRDFAPGCPRPATYQVPIDVSDGLENPPVTSVISLTPKFTTDQALCIGDFEGSPGCVGLSHLCWAFSTTGTFLTLPTYRVRRDPFKFPLDQIVAYHSFARTFKYEKDERPQGGFLAHTTVLVTFTPRH